MPKGEMSFMKESMREGFAELHHTQYQYVPRVRGMGRDGISDSHFHNTIIRTNIEHLPPKLMRQMRNRLQMLMLVSQRLTRSKPARMIIRIPSHPEQSTTSSSTQLFFFALLLQPLAFRVDFFRGGLLLAFLKGLHLGGHFAVMSEQLLEDFGAEDRDLGEEQLALDERRGGVVEDCPYWHQVFQLPARLLDDAVLAGEHDGHAREVLDFRVADDEGVDVEAARREDARHAGENTGFILDEAVEDVPFRGRGRGDRRFIEDRGYGCGGGEA
jgi:hypothetical protein